MVRSPLFVALLLAACSASPSFDSAAHLGDRLAESLGSEAAAQIELPFELDAEILAEVDALLEPRGGHRRRARQIVELIFGPLGLEYSTYPTRTASDTYRARQGNCLSFVNLFVGLARHAGLAPVYVEVIDRRGWSYRQGTVVSHGHIVAGLMIDGELETFDFLPYRAKSYRQLEPLGDLRGVAHFYSNVGAEALIAGDLDAAFRNLELVSRIDPDFVSGLNNLGVLLTRRDEVDGALQVYRRGLDLQPTNAALLSNAARLIRQQGRPDEADELLERLRQTRLASPFHYLVQGERALARGEGTVALERMREALRRDSELPEVHLGLVKTYLALGELSRARHHLGRASKLDPTHPEIVGYRELLEGNGS